MLMTADLMGDKKAEKHIRAILLKQWLYDSHLWIEDEEKMRVCKWCEARSARNIAIIEGQLFCPNNPIVEQIFNNVAKVIRETKA